MALKFPRLSVLLLTIGISSAGGDDAAPSGELFELEPVGPAPVSLLVDDARLFNEREAKQLSARLKEFSVQNDIRIYVAAYSVLIGESIDDRAARLKSAWLNGKPGVIVVYQRGTEQITFSSVADPVNFLERPELQTLFQRAYQAAVSLDRGSSRVIAATDVIMRDLPPAIQTHRASIGATASDTRTFVGWSLVGLAAIAAAGMFAFQFLRRAQVKVTKSFEFPQVKVAERFGAPYCGGHQAEIQFTVRGQG